jgi:phenylpropionate dioxygenase-like ring-hydroxylating dioxygenase large terminal subunit
MAKLTSDTDLFEAIRKPLLEASTLPPYCYTDESFFKREIDSIFLRHWQFVGHQDQIADAGQYRCYDGLGGSLIVIRGPDGGIRAFANSCRHRGSQLLSGNGQCKRIVCPYHSWVFRTDGQLIRAPGMDATASFEPADYPLLEFPVASWGGFIFVCYDREPPPFENQIGNMPQMFDAHRTETMKFVGSLEFEIHSNWKLPVENALEAYHTGSVHRDTLGQQESRSIDSSEHWTGLLVEDENSVATLVGEDKPFPHIKGLGNEAKSGAYFTVLFPATQFVFAQDCMWWLAFQPLAVDRTQLTLGACFPRETVDLDSFDEKVELYFNRWKLATAEDNRICELQQRGQVFARKPGRFAASEFAVHRFSNWIAEQLG